MLEWTLTDFILHFYVCFGMVAVFATFGFMMPVVGKTTASLFGIVMTEQAYAKMKGKRSGCEMDAPTGK